MASPNGIIALLTDFGERDYYVAAIKGAIYGIFPNARIVDISHQIEKFDIVGGAFVLWKASENFPEGTVYLGVVDPTVGASRDRIIVRTRRNFFVGPDNGLLWMASKADGIEGIFSIENEAYFLRGRARTFEGRDIFAPVAAHLASGVPPEEFGRKKESMVELDLGQAKVGEGIIECEVIYVDDFGNAITNLEGWRAEELIGIDNLANLKIGSVEKSVRFGRTYASVEEGDALLLVGSHGNLEVAIRGGSASAKLGIKRGDRIRIKWTS
ncbi:MAG: SAM-dependent chlorinase/fluorinase [Candidatus Bathyarchaeia archaeon]